MNSKRRALLSRADGLLTEALEIVDRAKDEESDALDNMPESMEDSDRYAKMEAAVDYLEDAYSAIEEAIDNIRDASQ